MRNRHFIILVFKQVVFSIISSSQTIDLNGHRFYLQRLSRGDSFEDYDNENGHIFVPNDLRPIPSAFIPNFYKRAHHPPPHHFRPEHDKEDDWEKSLMHIIFPVIIVFGIGSLIVPMIAVFFAAFMYNNGSMGGGGCFKNRQRTSRRVLPGNILSFLINFEKAMSSTEMKDGDSARAKVR